MNIQKQKIIVALGALLSFTNLKAQFAPSINCNNKPKATITNTVQTVIQTGTNGWFYFISSSRNPDIRLRNLLLPNYGGQIIYAKAFKGNCNSSTEIATDSISPGNDSLLVLSLSDVKIGDTITLFTKKKYSPKQCTVHPSQCNNAAVFQLNLIETKNAFTALTNITASNLNPTQLTLYNKIVSHNIYTSINFISIADIQTLAPMGKLNVNLPSIGIDNIPFEMSKVEFNNPFDFNWIGNQYVYDDSVNTYGSINLIKSREKFIGHITLDNKSYEIFDLTGGVQVIAVTNLNLFSPDECATGNRVSSVAASANQGPCADGKSKVLVFFTPSAQSVESDINGRVALAMSQLNQNWANSSISNNLTLVGVQPINFSETGNISNDLNTLKSLSNVTSLRNSLKAEIVIFLTNGNYGGIMGLAGGINANFNETFAIVDVTSSTTGRFTFAHEVNHLFGARHDNDPSPSNEHGHIFKTGTGWFGWGGVTRKTVMVVIPAGESRIEHTSNPNVNFMNVPTGVPFHNNAAQVNAMKTQIGGYYPDPIPATFNFSVFKAGCGNNWACYAEICNGTPYTYNWFWSPNGFLWIPGGSGFFTLVNVPVNNGLIKCEVRDPLNNLIFSLQKNVVKIGFCQGFAFRNSNIINNESNVEESVNLYSGSIKTIPNPNSGNFNIEINSNFSEENVLIVLTDISGKIVKEIYNNNLSVGKQNFDVADISKLDAGIYFVKAKGKNINLVDKIIIH
ncbi:MAG: T9SS type A sorting domain-containing protein [Bacteroidetes bacterium]|nr:T9SS type A sorting domain-containing protein [Bacteroidota bacterium]MCA6444822.1 T9SS type A sorting domain-containing protein [Bacteroidota bacterium]